MKLTTIFESDVFMAPEINKWTTARNKKTTIVDLDRAKQFTVSIEEQHAIDLIRTRCSDMLKGSSYLYRGLRKTRAEYFASDSSQIERVSLDNPNHYTKLMSAGGLDCWTKYPPRNMCTICTTADTGDSNEYGDTYVVFPENGTTIAICPMYDLWGSFPALLRAAGDDINGDRVYNLLSFFDSIDTTNSGDITHQLNQPIVKFFPQCASTGTVRQFLEQYMDPDLNKFELHTTSSLPSFPISHETFSATSREVWFSGKAVYVRYDMWMKIKDII